MSLKQAFLALGVLVLGLGAASAEAGCRKVRTKVCGKPAPVCGYVTVGYRLYNVDSCGRICNVRDYYFPGYGPTAPSETTPSAPEAPEAPEAPAPAPSTSRYDSNDQTDLLQSAPRRGTRNDPNANLRFRSAPRP